MSYPIIYKPGTTDFNNLGLGLLTDTEKAIVTEELNGQFIFEFTYPVGGALDSAIEEQAFVKVDAGNALKGQIFEIKRITSDTTYSRSVYAEHISYRLNGIPTKAYTATGNGLQMLTAWKAQLLYSSDLFTVKSDVTTQSNGTFTPQTFGNARTVLGGQEGSILDLVGGQYKFDNFEISLLNQRGKESHDMLVYGKNITTLTQEENITSTYNAIYPYAQFTDDSDSNKTIVKTLPETIVKSKYFDNFNAPVVQVVDFSDKFTGDNPIKNYDDGKLRAFAKQYITNNKVGIPEVSITLSTVDMNKALGENVESLDLGDTIKIYFQTLRINTLAQVSAITWNVLLDQYDSYTIGTKKRTLTQQFINNVAGAKETADKALQVAQSASVIAANGKTSDYFGHSINDPFPANPKVGDKYFVKDGDNEYILQWDSTTWVELVSTKTGEYIANKVDEAVTTAASQAAAAIEQNNASQQEVMNDIAKSQANLAIKDGDFNNKAQAMADKALADSKDYTATVASKSLGTYLVRLLPGTNIFKTANSTTIQAQVWKAGQDITSTLDNASFSWKIAKDGADAIGLTSNIKSVVAKPSDFNNTGTYIVNVIIPVTDINGTTRNQTFSDSTTIAKVTDGVNGRDGAQGIPGKPGADGKTPYLHTAWTNMTLVATEHNSFTLSKNAIVRFGADDNWLYKTFDAGTYTASSSTFGGDPYNGYSKVAEVVSDFSVDQSANKAYLGTYTNFTQADSTNPADYTWSLIKGADGKNGTNGNGISSTTITYATSASGTIAPTSGYTSTIPTVNKGQFLWQRTTTSYTNGTTKNSDVVTYFAKDGLNGVDGMDGGQGMIAQPSKPTSGLVNGFLWLDTSQTYPVYYIYDSSIKDFKIYQFNAKNINADQIKAKFVGTDRLSASQIIADDLHVKSANIDGKITASQVTVSSTNGTQTSLANFDLDGFNATVTKVDNLSVGGRNYVLNSSGLNGSDTVRPTLIGTSSSANTTVTYPSDGILMTNSNTNTTTEWYYQVATAWSNFSDTPLTPGKQITFSADVMGTVPQVVLRHGFNGGTGQKESFKAFDINNTSWTRISITTTSTPTNTGLYFRIQGGIRNQFANGWTGGETLKFRYVKIEEGNVATDWSPAPEDADNKISTVSHTVEGISSIVSDPTTGLTKRVQTAEGTLSKVQGIDIPALQKATFWQPYSSLNFNDYTEQGSFFFNTTSAKTNGPTDRLSWTYLMVEQGTTDNGRIKQTAWYDGVEGVKITYVRTLNSGTWSPWYANDNDSVTTISQTNESIKQEIHDRKNGDDNTFESSKNFTKSSITKYDEGIQSQFTQTASGILAQVESTNMVVNSEFDPLNGTWYRLSNGGYTGSQLAEAWNAPKASGFSDWPVVNGSRVISYESATWYTSALVIAGAGKVFSASIVAGRGSAQTVSTALDFRIGFWDSSRKLLTTASAGNIIDRTTYKGAQKYVVENKIAPANTAFVSVIIAHSSADATDYITRPSLNTGIKASPYTPTYGTSNSSTILSLLKDNWSIGITNNTGNLINGINGDGSNVRIAAKKLIIDQDVTIGGTGWLNGAVIKNASIGSAQIGTIDASDGRIINLDVKYLSGDSTNFVKSKWANAYSNVTIDTSGMEIDTNNQFAKLTQGSLVLKSFNNTTNVKENIGWFTHTKSGGADWVDYLAIVLDGYSDNGKPGVSHSAVHGADGFSININEGGNGNSRSLLEWASTQAGRVTKKDAGWHVQDRLYVHEGLYVNGVNEHWRVSWTAWSDWGNYRNVSLTNPKGSAGIAVNGDNLILFGTNKRTDGTRGWNV